MSIRLAGCSHHQTPIEVREKLSVPAGRLDQLYERWRAEFPTVELTVLSTCNRIELYAAYEETPVLTAESLIRFLTEFNGVDFESVRNNFYEHHNRDVISHLFSVVASLDSMVLGEPQIAAQVKDAYQRAVNSEATGPILHGIFQRALRTARQIAEETQLHQHRISIPSVAVADFARQIFENFDDKQTVILGAGEMAEETLRYLINEGAQKFTVLNRTDEKATQLADCFGAKTAPWSTLEEQLIAADLLIAATGAEEPIVTEADFKKIEPARKKRPLFILDLALPRNIAPALARRSDVYLYSIDDLKLACQKNRDARDREIPAAQKIVDQATDSMLADLRHRSTGPIISRLRGQWQKPKEDELRRLFNKRPDWDEATRDELAQSFDRLINKLLHPPMEQLRDESRRGISSNLAESLAKLFKLKD
jgi:glutamyl-tRNA reductase